MGGDINITCWGHERFPFQRNTRGMWNFNKFIVLANLIKFLFKMEHTHVLGRATRFPDLYGTDSLLIKNGVMCLTILESLDKHLF